MPFTPATTADVGKVVEVDTDIDLQPFLDYAYELVDERCTSSGYTDNRLTMIHTWLAAHFYAIRDPQLRVEDAGKIRAEYQHKVDLRLNLTHQGQQAMLLDTGGNLAALNNTLGKVTTLLTGPSAATKNRIAWLGTSEEDFYSS